MFNPFFTTVLVYDFCALLLLTMLPVTSVTQLPFFYRALFTENIPTNNLCGTQPEDLLLSAIV